MNDSNATYEGTIDGEGDPLSKGLKTGALGLISVTVIGVASTAPGYSLAAGIGGIAGEVGNKIPIIMILAFIPMFFIAKAYDVPYINIAARVMLGVNKLKDFNIERKLTGYAIKEPVFSYEKFPEVAKELGPEMKSTGEAIRFIKDLEDPYFRSLVKVKSLYLSK